jgi:hypothetical protein
MDSAPLSYPETLFSDAETLLRHTDFPSARTVYAKAMHRMFKAERVARFLVNETARSLISNICIYADLDFDPATPGTGLTVRKLQRLCSARGLASPGRVFAFVNMMRLSGYLRTEPVQDQRYKILRPTDKLHAYRRDLMQCIFSAVDIVSHRGDYAQRASDPATDRQILRVAGSDYFERGLLLLDYHPDIKMFADRDGGYHFLLELLHLSGFFSGDYAPGRTLDISLTQMGLRCFLSRSHLRSILNDAAERGLIAFATGPGITITLQNTLTRLYDQHVAILLAYYGNMVDNRVSGGAGGTP